MGWRGGASVVGAWSSPLRGPDGRSTRAVRVDNVRHGGDPSIGQADEPRTRRSNVRFDEPRGAFAATRAYVADRESHSSRRLDIRHNPWDSQPGSHRGSGRRKMSAWSVGAGTGLRRPAAQFFIGRDAIADTPVAADAPTVDKLLAWIPGDVIAAYMALVLAL